MLVCLMKDEEKTERVNDQDRETEIMAVDYSSISHLTSLTPPV